MCIFCKIVSGEIPSYKVYEDEDMLAFLDINPVTKGHTVVIPKKHYDDILDCDLDVYQKMMVNIKKLAKIIMERTNAKGINIITNCKEAAGQEVKHFHVHIIPRYDETDGYKAVFEKKVFDLDSLIKDLQVNKL